MRPILLLAGLLTVAAPAGAQAPSALLVLLRNDKAMAIVDPGKGTILARVPAGEDPRGVAVSADGALAFVADMNGGAILVIDVAARKQIRRVDLGAGSSPQDIHVAGGHVYFTAEGFKAIGRYDPAADKIDWWIGTGQNSTHTMTLSKDADVIVAGNRASNSVSVVEKVSAGPPDWIVTLIPTGKSAQGIGMSPDGREVWTANWEIERDGVSIIDVASKQVTHLPVRTQHANRVVFTPDGRRVLLADESGGELWVFDAASRKDIQRIKVAPGALLLTADGSRAYAAVSRERHIAVIDLNTLSVTGRIDTGSSPGAMAWGGPGGSR